MDYIEEIFSTYWKLFLLLFVIFLFVVLSTFGINLIPLFFSLWFLWLPILLGFFAWRAYRIATTDSFILKKLSAENYKMLEISIPRDVHKSPAAMELAIDVLWHLGGGGMGWQNRIWDGAVLLPASLEIISVEGSIYFFIRAHVQYADLVTSTIYSQYPDAEIHEVDDYTKYVPDLTKHQDDWSMYGATFALSTDNFVPIKTYIDYGLDTAVGNLEENQKIDPMTPLLEYLGSLRKGEQMWIQIILRADALNDWRTRAKDYIADLMQRSPSVDSMDVAPTAKLTHGEQEKIKAIERSLGKHAFETKIRALYLAPNKYYNKSRTGFFKNSIFKPFGSQYLNTIKKNDDTDPVDWFWQDITGLRVPVLEKRFFTDYINREAFYEGFLKYFNFLWYEKKDPSILTSEELATLFHIPGRVSETGNLERIDATKAEAPQNLPM